MPGDEVTRWYAQFGPPAAYLELGFAALLVRQEKSEPVVDFGFYGSLTPRREAMTVDTIFDAASLTKVVATTPALMTFSGATDWAPELPENDPVRDYVNHLRRVTGRRSVLLCSRCVEENRQYRAPVPASVVSDRLFDL